MQIPRFLVDANVASPKIDYKWTIAIQNGFLSADADTKPSLGKAVGKISARAAYSLAVASCEWIATRLSSLADSTDAFMRIEAGWAASIDPRYATLPTPDRGPPRAEADPILDPLRLAMVLLSEAHDACLNEDIAGIFISAIRLLLLAEHVAGRNAAFKVWLPAILKFLAAEHPYGKKALEDQFPVPREVFESLKPPKGVAINLSQSQFLKGLKVDDNRYLKPAAILVKEGVSKDPYLSGS